GGAANNLNDGRNDGAFKRRTSSFAAILDGTSNTLAISEARLQFETMPASPAEKDFDRLSVLGEGATSDYVNPDLTAFRASVSLTHRGFPWIAGRHYASGFSAYSAPNARVPSIWLRGWELLFEGAASNHPGIVVAGMADGSVRNVAETVDLSVWRAAATAAGSETTAL
ncbi:MAG: DUF1559 domain-containing protein, partial [Thermoguttaceae bacterium]|nr:DUF1559 domain-containing protein [Thermoguttaceae bacterium]